MRQKIFSSYRMTERLSSRFYSETINGGDDDLLVFWRRIKGRLSSLLKDKIRKMGAIKVSLLIDVRLRKEDRETLAALRSRSMTLLRVSEVGEQLALARDESSGKLSSWTREGSGWMVDEVEGMDVSIARYELSRGGTYVELPLWVKRKHAIINVKNKDDRCFLWAMRAALFEPIGDPNRVTSYPEDDLDWSGIEFPVALEDVGEFEKKNDLRINVYGCRDEVIVPLKLTKDPEVHLFYFGDHYSWVKNPDRLFSRITKHDGKKHICYNCMQPFTSKKALKEHGVICQGYSEVATQVQMPANKEFGYKDYQKQLPVPYVIYADFESLILPDGTHEACSYGYVVVRQDGKAGPPQLYRGPKAAEKLLEDLRGAEEEIRELLRSPKAMRMTDQDKLNHSRAKACHICESPLLQYGRRDKACYKGDKYLGSAHWWCGKYDKGKRGKPTSHCIHCQEPIKEDFYVDKVRDHCHVTGKYRGAAHWACNASFRINTKMEIPVFFHNLRGYDSHLLLQGVTDEKVKCIPNNKERYMSVTIGGLRFLDSMQFMGASLESLAKSAPALPISDKHGAERKGVYPYEWMDGWDKFKEVLPPKEAFYSRLRRENISDEDYEHAKDVWKRHGCQNMGDYHDIYLLSDVTLLADVFQGFREMCKGYYGLDPANFYTAPGLSWSALLKMTKPALDLLTDYDKHLFIEQGIRGGVCGPSVRYARANNPMVKDYDPSRPNEWIYYLDANNLYGWAMSQPLPVRDFEWVIGEWSDFDVAVDSPKGYILEVDLEYPKKLHDLHNDFPMAPENGEIPFEMLSPYQKEMMPNYKPHRKLIMSLLPKKHYVVHYRNLQLYVKHGLRISKIHRVLQFTQEAWMKPYIDFNTRKRAETKVKFEQDLFKLMNNSVFGKTMENIRKRVTVKIVGTEEEAAAYASKPGYVGYVKMLNFWVVSMKKSVLLFNKPVYTGFTVLDLSKLLMYQFYYEKLKPKYGNKCRLLYTDTDSLLVVIRTGDVYEDTLEDLDEYDTSGYPEGHFLYSKKNKKVIGKMKDEMAGTPIEEYVGLRPKMYSLLHGKETKKA
ncbi:MAG: DNA polymerase, partial [Bacteroidota bacterium]